jgi:hypothetical protein
MKRGSNVKAEQQKLNKSTLDVDKNKVLPSNLSSPLVEEEKEGRPRHIARQERQER